MIHRLRELGPASIEPDAGRCDDRSLQVFKEDRSKLFVGEARLFVVKQGGVGPLELLDPELEGIEFVGQRAKDSGHRVGECAVVERVVRLCGGDDAAGNTNRGAPLGDIANDHGAGANFCPADFFFGRRSAPADARMSPDLPREDSGARNLLLFNYSDSKSIELFRIRHYQ